MDKKIKKLREDCMLLMAKKGLSKRGGQKQLAERLNINRNSLSMALSGYRSGAGAEEILKNLKETLRAMS